MSLALSLCPVRESVALLKHRLHQCCLELATNFAITRSRLNSRSPSFATRDVLLVVADSKYEAWICRVKAWPLLQRHCDKYYAVAERRFQMTDAERGCIHCPDQTFALVVFGLRAFG